MGNCVGTLRARLRANEPAQGGRHERVPKVVSATDVCHGQLESAGTDTQGEVLVETTSSHFGTFQLEDYGHCVIVKATVIAEEVETTPDGIKILRPLQVILLLAIVLTYYLACMAY